MQTSTAVFVFGAAVLGLAIARSARHSPEATAPSSELYAGYDVQVLEESLPPGTVARYAAMGEEEQRRTLGELNSAYSLIQTELLKGLVAAGAGAIREFAPGELATPIPRPDLPGNWFYSYTQRPDGSAFAMGALADDATAAPLVELRREILWLQRELGIEEGTDIQTRSPRADHQ